MFWYTAPIPRNVSFTYIFFKLQDIASFQPCGSNYSIYFEKVLPQTCIKNCNDFNRTVRLYTLSLVPKIFIKYGFS